MAPVQPVGPVTVEAAPVGPVHPVGPVGPIGPVAPVIVVDESCHALTAELYVHVREPTTTVAPLAGLEGKSIAIRVLPETQYNHYQ